MINEESAVPNYCVNKQAQANGDHEVHDLSFGACNRLPLSLNQLALGYHANCQSAVRAAKLYYAQSNGCYYCCPACNTG